MGQDERGNDWAAQNDGIEAQWDRDKMAEGTTVWDVTIELGQNAIRESGIDGIALGKSEAQRWKATPQKSNTVYGYNQNSVVINNRTTDLVYALLAVHTLVIKC